MRNFEKNSFASAESLCSLFCVAGEMKEKNGEDSYYYATNGNKVVVSVFDGCGGIGSRRYGNYSGKTGAYVASRAVCGGVKNWFETDGANPETIKLNIERALKVCDKFADKGGRLMGSLGKDFPTTAAITVATQRNGGIDAICYWAGDSRCYMLDYNGLHQLSLDDVDGEDAFSNLSDDGVLKNVITANFAFTVNRKDLQINHPCILFTATDGCFGYVNTPMDFEYLLLDVLTKAESIKDWQTKLNSSILKFAGDDYTMSVASFGFESFDALKGYFAQRKAIVEANYINTAVPVEQRWELYKKEYYAL